MSGTALSLSVEQFNRAMLTVANNYDKVIRKKLRELKSIYRNIQPEGTFTLGEGYIRKVSTFHPGMDDQAGLLKWEPEGTFRAPGTNSPTDPGFDPCAQTAYMLGYGFKTEEYSGWRTARRSPDYCINEWLYEWQFEQQLKMILESFAAVGVQIWDNFGREMYMNFANKFVLTGSLTPVRFTYDPFTSTRITVPVGTRISTLSPKHMDFYSQMLGLQCPDGALATENDMPVFGFNVHPFDFDDMLHRNTKLHEEYLYANPTLLVDGVGKLRKFRNYALSFDLMAPRFKDIGHDENGNLLFERVVPFKQETITQGSRWEPDPEYLKAEYTIINIIVKNVYEKQVPPVAPGKIAGATFGTTPSNNGEMRWINIPDRATNMLGEKGLFFGRFKGFAKPLENNEYAVSLFVKRCPHTPIELCEPCEDATSGAKTVTDVTPIDELGTNSYQQVKVKISDTNGLGCEANAAVTVTFKDATTVAALIADDSGAPAEYVLTFATEAAWAANGGGIASVTCA